jgi:heptosyltransferase-2
MRKTRPPLNPDRVRKILVLRLSHLGDVLLTIPLLKALDKTFPRAEIRFLTHAEYLPLFSIVPAVDRAIGLSPQDLRSNRKESITRINRSGPYQLLLDLHNVPATRKLRRSICAEQVLVSAKHTLERWLLILLKKDLLPRQWEVAEGHLSLLQKLDAKVDAIDYHLEVDESAGKKLAGEHNISLSPPPIALAPFATRKTREWPSEYYAELARLAHSRWKAAILVIGSPAEKERGDVLIEEMHRYGVDAINLASKLSLAELPHLLSQCSALVGGDTGLVHLAGACGTPTLAIFGPTTTRLGFAPLGDNSIAVGCELPCRPCSRHGGELCPLGTLECMEKLKPQEVCQLLSDLLET